MRGYEELVAQGCAAPVEGWDFGFLDGRATEQRPPWGYSRLLHERLGRVSSALDIDTGGGEVIAEAPRLPADMTVTEAWPPNVARARQLLEPRGVTVVQCESADLPWERGRFDLVSSRHPIRPHWGEIARVLNPGGHYFAQHVGPGSAGAVIAAFRGPQPPESAQARHPSREFAAARAAGLDVIDLRTVRCRIEIFDVGALVWLLRRCPWWVPDFDTTADEDVLRRLDASMRAGRPVVAHSTRHLIEATR